MIPQGPSRMADRRQRRRTMPSRAAYSPLQRRYAALIDRLVLATTGVAVGCVTFGVFGLIALALVTEAGDRLAAQRPPAGDALVMAGSPNAGR